MTRPTAPWRSPCWFALAFLLASVQCTEESNATKTVPAPAPAASAATASTPSAQAQAPVLGERIHVVVSGRMEGKLEPCGCASGQLGGLPRRITYLQEIHGADLLLEGGGFAAGGTVLDQEKAFTAVEVLFGMPVRYDALGLAKEDLQLPVDAFGEYVQAYDAPLVASDLVAKGSKLVPKPFVEKTVRTAKVRIVSLCMELPEALAKAEPRTLELLSPEAGYARGLEGSEASTLRVLLVHASADTAKALARRLEPRPDLVVGISDDVHEPPSSPSMVGDVPVVFPGTRGRFVVDLRFGRTEVGAAIPQYEAVPLRASETKPLAGQDPAVREVLRKHRLFVAEEKLREQLASKIPTANGLAYVGSARCAECHVQDHELWKNSKHGGAWATLERAEQDPSRYGWPVTKYPDCVSCHVVGYGEQSGFVSPETTPDLANVGCERCHGPGSAHSQDPTQRMGKVGNGQASMVCTQCHDFEQSPTFDYVERWKRIEHGLQKAKKR